MTNLGKVLYALKTHTGGRRDGTSRSSDGWLRSSVGAAIDAEVYFCPTDGAHSL